MLVHQLKRGWALALALGAAAWLAGCASPQPVKVRTVVNERPTAEMLAAIDKHYLRDEFAEAVRLGDRWRPSQLPDETNVILALSRVRVREGDAEYPNLLLGVETKYPTSILVKLEAGMYLQKRGQKNLAYGYFKDIIAAQYKSLMERRARAYALAHLGKYDRKYYDEALLLLVQLIEGGDASRTTLYYDGIVARELKLFKHAEDALRKALEEKPNDLEVVIALAGTLDDAGQSVEAIKELAKIADQYPDNPMLQLQLGITYLSLKQWINAEAALVKTNELSSAPIPLAIANLAEAYLRVGKRDLAFRQAQRATALAPDEPYAWAVLAAVCNETNRPTTQRNAMEKLRALSLPTADRLVIRRFDLRAFAKNP